MKKSLFKVINHITIAFFISSIIPLISHQQTVYAADSIITTVAGNGVGGYSGDGGAATMAQIAMPSKVAVDGSGNIYFTANNHRVRKVDTSGTITTIAGNGVGGYSGDGGAATLAELAGPIGVDVDSSGNIYIADSLNNRIRKVDTSGTITTIAGNGVKGYSGDGGAATYAMLSNPGGVVVDGNGNVYIDDVGNSRIRKVDTSGTITTIAGNGTNGFGGDGGAATSAQLYFPRDLAMDESGSIYIADTNNYRVRKVDTSGTITTFAGNGTAGYNGDGGAATSAQIGFPSSLAIDSSGNIYIGDSLNYNIRKVDTSGTITTFAGNGISGFSGDGGVAASAQISSPQGLAIDGSGNLYLTDSWNYRVRKVSSLSSTATLSNLSMSNGTLTPVFSSTAHSYTASVTGNVENITVTPTVSDSHATVTVDGGEPSVPVNLNIGDNIISVLVTAEDGTTVTYTVTVTKGDINLFADGREGFVHLNWSVIGFVSYSGYNLYRSDSASGTFVKLNAVLIPMNQILYEDNTAQVGTPYYYKMTIVKNDLTESDFSNLESAAAIDTTLPVIQHTPTINAEIGQPIEINADVTDNISVKLVSLYYKKSGTTSFTKLDMANIAGNIYSASIDGSSSLPPGIDYYIEATDGVSTVSNGSAAAPNHISIVEEPKITAVTPNQGPIAGGTTVVITGINFKPGASISLDGVTMSNTTYISSSEISIVTPAHYPSIVDLKVTNPDLAKTTMLRAFSYIEEGVDVTISNAQGGLGQIIEVPISISSVQGFKAADITLDYDEDILTAQSVRVGSFTNNFTVSANTNTPGQVIISMANATQTTGSGSIAYVSFKIADSTIKISSTLTLSSVVLNGGNIRGSIFNGLFNLSPKYSISGSVQYYSNSAAVSGVNIVLSGGTRYIGTSIEDGSYSINNVAGGDYNLTTSKSNEATDITAYDASLILQYASRLINLTDNQKIASDVNGDGTVNSMDASAVLAKSVDLISLPFSGAGKVWTFEPSQYTYTNLFANKTGQNFNAILIGDVSGSWGSITGQSLRTTGLTAQALLENHAAFTLGTVTKNPDGTYSVPIRVDMTNANLYSVDLVFNYNSLAESIVSVNKTTFSNNFNIAYNNNSDGTIKIAMASAKPLTASGNLVVIKFRLAKGIAQLSGLTIASVVVNEGAVNSIIQENFKVKSIKLSTGKITPTFSPSVLYYTATVSNRSTSIKITSVVEDNGVLKTVTQEYNLAVGKNTLQLIFTSSSGTELSYIIEVTRKAK